MTAMGTSGEGLGTVHGSSVDAVVESHTYTSLKHARALSAASSTAPTTREEP